MNDIANTVYQSAMQILQAIGKVLLSREIIALATIAAAFIAVYRLVYLRPELFIEPNVESVHEREENTKAIMSLFLVNGGNRFAEDVQVTLTLDAFKFDNDIESTDYVTNRYQVPQTTLDIRSGRKSGYVGGGRRHDIYVENPVYEKDVMKMWFGTSIFNEEGKQELKYTVACRTHGLRKGKIIFEIDSGKMTIEKKHPTKLRKLKQRIGLSPKLKREERVENLKDDSDIHYQYQD